MVCDMSSDIFSKPIDPQRFGLIYAGAQKNLGPAGVTLVIVRKDMLGKINKTLPTMLRYETHIQNESMYNTPPVFPIYVSMLTLRWLKNLGGLGVMQQMKMCIRDSYLFSHGAHGVHGEKNKIAQRRRGAVKISLISSLLTGTC